VTAPALNERWSKLRIGVPDPVKVAGRRASRAVGLATADRRLLPTFLVVGAQRAGTTSLHRALVAHPAIVAPNLHKGVHYFDVAHANGLRWYRAHFPLEGVARARAGHQLQAFESSGYYMHHPLAPGRIAADLPEVRLVAMLRDPVERAHSAHRHELDRGFEHLGFEEALELEPSRLAGEIDRMIVDPAYVSHAHRHQAYVQRGQYVEQLRVLFDLFGRDRVHVVWSEDFFERPEETFAGVLEFLRLPVSLPRVFDRWNARPRGTMPEATRRLLEAHFRPYDDDLALVLGEEPSWRR
jgi:hypothetical protein